MIKVTLGDKPAQESKPFPKLMRSEDNYKIIEVLKVPNEKGVSPVIVRYPEYCFIESFQVVGGTRKYIDYNEPITIQNA